MPSTVSLVGMYEGNPNLFSEMSIPGEISREDVIIPMIFLECAELEVVYSDPFFMQKAIGVWSKSRLTAWGHYLNIHNVAYDPIENYNRYEDRNIERNDNETTDQTTNRNLTIAHNGEESGSDSADSVSHSNSSGNSDTEDIGQVSAFDTSSFANSNKQTGNTNATSSTSGTETVDKAYSTHDSYNDTHNDVTTGKTTNKLTGSTTDTAHIHGNIGVTTNQQMLNQEVEFWKWDFVHQIVSEFRKFFCISVY